VRRRHCSRRNALCGPLSHSHPSTSQLSTKNRWGPPPTSSAARVSWSSIRRQTGVVIRLALKPRDGHGAGLVPGRVCGLVLKGSFHVIVFSYNYRFLTLVQGVECSCKWTALSLLIQRCAALLRVREKKKTTNISNDNFSDHDSMNTKGYILVSRVVGTLDNYLCPFPVVVLACQKCSFLFADIGFQEETNLHTLTLLNVCYIFQYPIPLSIGHHRWLMRQVNLRRQTIVQSTCYRFS